MAPLLLSYRHLMNGKSAHIRWVQLVAAMMTFWTASFSAQGVETFVTRTNWVEKAITNVIEVSMPMNRFVNVYRTNRVEQFRTNVIDLYATNWVGRTATNRLVV